MTIGVRQVATSSALLLVENLIRLSVVALVSFWIARQLGPAQFGVLNFASALVAILLSLSTLGLDTPVILRLTRSEDPGSVLKAALAMRSIAAIVMFAAALGLAWLLKRHEPTALLVTWVASLSILAAVLTVYDYWFKAKTLPVRPAVARIAGTLLSSGAKVACLLLGLGVVALAWTIALEALISGIGIFLAYRSIRHGFSVANWRIDWQLVFQLVKDGWPYMLSAAVVVAYMKIDVVMLGYLSSNTETGIYSLAQKISEVLCIVPVVLIDSAYPILAKKFVDSNSKNGVHGQMLFDLAVGGSMLATLFAVALAAPIINTLFGAGYEQSIGIFYLHAWSCIAIALNTARHRWLAAIGLQKYVPVVTVVGLIANVGINLILIPAYGAMGAAIATLVSYFLSAYFSSFFLKPLREIALMQTRSLWPWFRLYRAARILNSP